MTKTRKILTFMLPGLIIIGAIIASYILVQAKPQPEKKPAAEIARNVRVVTAHEGTVSLSVHTQGTVKSKQQIGLMPQVSGQVIQVADNFVAGGRFKKGEVILRLDPRDYEYEVTSARSRVVESQQVLVREQAEAALAKTEWDLLGHGEASDLTLRKPQLADAEAKLNAAQASLKKAELSLQRTEIRAPFDGILISKEVDFGQFIGAGTRIGEYYSTDVLEVRLPLSSRDLSQLDARALQSGTSDLHVTLKGTFAGIENTWKAKITRTEGLIDSKTRILYAVAELSGDEIFSTDSKMPISIGQFVSAEVEGRQFNKVFKLPRDVLRQGNKVLVVDKENKLHSRTVSVAESNREFIVITAGLQEGDIICKSQLGLDVDGLLVKFEGSEGGQS